MSKRLREPLTDRHRDILSTLYGALLTISSLRTAIVKLRGEMSDACIEHFTRRLDCIESAAVLMLTQAERSSTRTVTH